MQKIVRIAFAVLILSRSFLGAQVESHAVPEPPSLVLEGEVSDSRNHTYLEVPFTVPPNTHRISVKFHNLGRDQHTVMDLAIADPSGFRGASGGNKDAFTISESDATPSYLPGPIPSGQWKLLIAIPNIRPGVRSGYRAEVWFNSRLDDSSFTREPLNPNPGWFRGDLHMHTAHSDGSCPSQSGKLVPCPLFFTVEDAVRRGLDFIAITDHNTTSHYDDERELQPWFDKLLLVPGREITTFHGHANEFGTTRSIDYRLGTAAVPEANTILRKVHDLGAIISINHPESPTGEICMGCGWDPAPPADMTQVNAIEVVNGGGTPATRFWEEQLGKGYRLTAIGGSDNHRADWASDKPGSVGYPTTVIYAQNLSVQAILDGITSGHVFIDVTGSRDRVLDLNARTANSSASMGGTLRAPNGEGVEIETHVLHCSGGAIHFFLDGHQTSTIPLQHISDEDQTVRTEWKSDGASHWLRAEVRDSQDRLLLLGNPIYVNWIPKTRSAASAGGQP